MEFSEYIPCAVSCRSKQNEYGPNRLDKIMVSVLRVDENTGFKG